jgi:hypothetical protein
MHRKLVARTACLGAVALTVAACGASSKHDPLKAHTIHASDRHASTPTTSVATATTPEQTSTVSAASKPSLVVECLNRAGLANATPTSSNRWQGVVGDHPLSDETASVFVVGPYSSAAAVRRAVPTVGPGENAAAGGLYLLVGSTAGHTATPITKAAACLRSGSDSTAKPKRQKSYKF